MVGGGSMTQQEEQRERVLGEGEKEREVNASDILRYSTLKPKDHLKT